MCALAPPPAEANATFIEDEEMAKRLMDTNPNSFRKLVRRHAPPCPAACPVCCPVPKPVLSWAEHWGATLISPPGPQVATFLEANGRGYWDASPEALDRLKQLYM